MYLLHVVLLMTLIIPVHCLVVDHSVMVSLLLHDVIKDSHGTYTLKNILKVIFLLFYLMYNIVFHKVFKWYYE